jgi:hypothetical protein
MALVLNDRVKETSTTTGTGTLNLAGAVTGFETFVAGIGNSNTTYYAITLPATAEFEVGLGTITDASPDTLARTTVISSSNSDNAVNFSAGTKTIFCTMPASKTVFLDASGNATFGGDIDVDGTTNLDIVDIDGAVDMASTATITGNLTLGAQLIMPDVTSTKILVADGTSFQEVAVSGDITIANTGAVTIASTAVETAMIAADAITSAKIADDAIDSEHYTDGSIDTAHIADAQVTVAKMAANSVDSDQYVDGSIDTIHIADVQVTTAKIAADAITEAKIADNAVESEHLNDNVISGQTELASGLALTDELLVSDGGTIKRMDVSVLTAVTDDNATALAIALG